MEYEKKVQNYVHQVLNKHNVKKASKLEDALNYKAISKEIDRLKDKGESDSQITTYIMEEIKKGAEDGGKGKFYSTTVPKKFLKGVKKIGNIEVSPPTSNMFYLRHPIQGLRNLIRKGTGYEPPQSKTIEVLNELSNKLKADKTLSNRAAKTAQELSKLDTYKSAVDLLYAGHMIGGYKAKALKHKIESKIKKGSKGSYRHHNKRNQRSDCCFIIPYRCVLGWLPVWRAWVHWICCCRRPGRKVAVIGDLYRHTINRTNPLDK